MYCIINKENGEIYYLAWQNPVSYGEDGYFWTSKEILTKCRSNNTEEHPFLFVNRTEAIKHLKTLNIPQKCSIVKI